MGNDVGGPVGATALDFGTWASPRNIWTLGNPVRISTDGTDVTPAVTEEFVAEIYVPHPVYVTGFALFNGSAVTDDVMVQLYSATGKRIVKSASTLQAGTDALQRVPFSAPVKLPAGTYYVGVQVDGTTSRLNCHVLANGGTVKKTGQVYGTFVDFTPPTTFTASVGPMGALY
jgi:hypothetical protein